jgi:hypothetical protein
MAKKNLETWVQENSILALIIVLGTILVLAIFGIIVSNKLDSKKDIKTVTTVSFADGQNEITIDRNGNVTIKTPFGTFTQKWDKEKVRRFFENFNNLDFNTLSQFLGTSLAIQLTLSNGEKITIDISEISEDSIDEIIETLEEIYEDEDMEMPPLITPAPYVPPDEQDDDSDDSNGSSDNDDPWHQGSDPVDIEVFECEQVDPITGRRVIISNTVCAQ